MLLNKLFAFLFLGNFSDVHIYMSNQSTIGSDGGPDAIVLREQCNKVKSISDKERTNGLSLACGTPLVARYVTILKRRDSDKYYQLVLCEVIIMGYQFSGNLMLALSIFDFSLP